MLFMRQSGLSLKEKNSTIHGWFSYIQIARKY